MAALATRLVYISEGGILLKSRCRKKLLLYILVSYSMMSVKQLRKFSCFSVFITSKLTFHVKSARLQRQLRRNKLQQSQLQVYKEKALINYSCTHTLSHQSTARNALFDLVTKTLHVNVMDCSSYTMTFARNESG